MKKLREKMIAYLKKHPIDFGYSDADTVTEFLYDAFCEARQEEPPEIKELAKQLSPYLERMPRAENDAIVWDHHQNVYRPREECLQGRLLAGVETGYRELMGKTRVSRLLALVVFFLSLAG